MRKEFLSVIILCVLPLIKLFSQTAFEDSLSHFPFKENQYYQIEYSSKSVFIFNLVPAPLLINRIDSLQKVSDTLATNINKQLPAIRSAKALFVVFTPQYYIFRSQTVGFIYSLTHFIGKGIKDGFNAMVNPGYLDSSTLSRLLKFPLAKNQSIQVIYANKLPEIQLRIITDKANVNSVASIPKAKRLAGSIYNNIVYPDCTAPVAIKVIGIANNSDRYKIERSFIVENCLLADLNEEDQFKERLKKYHWLPDQYFSLDSIDKSEIQFINLVDSPMNYYPKETKIEIRNLFNRLSEAFKESTFLDYSKFTVVYGDRHATPYSQSVYWEFKMDKYGHIDLVSRYVIKGTVANPLIPVPDSSLAIKIASYPLLPNQYIFYWPTDPANQEVRIVNLIEGDCPTKVIEDEIKLKTMALDFYNFLTRQEGMKIKTVVVQYRDRFQCYPDAFLRVEIDKESLNQSH